MSERPILMSKQLCLGANLVYKQPVLSYGRAAVKPRRDHLEDEPISLTTPTSSIVVLLRLLHEDVMQPVTSLINAKR
ncbi:unnamed protein product [Protopolystoma xenopodis]|uniref:Uncharacterized protein n=1 Tax=Protopolystoma xenopodis TaxID=117903 RepID=A0A448WBK3_9PLAT|nr:unnamed protein product [Protopolystoma xenopodis]